MKKDKNKITFYCDMDGVLADFNAEPDGINRFRVEKGFFANLKPIKNNVKTIKKMVADGYKVNILSASPNSVADGDKIVWLKKYLPELDLANVIIIRNHENKADYATADGHAILFDDYGHNCECFRQRGHKAYKIDKKHPIKVWLRTIKF